VTYQLRSTTITFDAALRDLKSSNDRARVQAAHALGDVLDPEQRKQAVAALIEVLDDDRQEVRAEAALSLGDLETEAAVEPLVARCDDPVPAVRQSAMIALGRLGFSSSFDAVARALEKGPPDLRFQAATSLAEIDQDRAREPLLGALDDADGEVVSAVALSLGAIGERRAANRMAELLDTWSRPETRFDLAYALADLGDSRALPVLVELVSKDDLAWDAIEGLEKIVKANPGQARPAIEPLAGILSRLLVPPRLKLRAAAAVLRMTPPRPSDDAPGSDPDADDADDADGAVSDELHARARAALLAGVSARKLENRGLAVQLLGEVGGEWAIEPLDALHRRRAGRRLQDEITDSVARIRQRSEPETGPYR